VRAGRLNAWVTLTSAPDVDGIFDGTPSPRRIPVAIEPLTPQATGRIASCYVHLRYHPQITIDTCLTTVEGSRQLFVKGIQHIDERRRDMVLYCEETL